MRACLWYCVLAETQYRWKHLERHSFSSVKAWPPWFLLSLKQRSSLGSFTLIRLKLPEFISPSNRQAWNSVTWAPDNFRLRLCVSLNHQLLLQGSDDRRLKKDLNLGDDGKPAGNGGFAPHHFDNTCAPHSLWLAEISLRSINLWSNASPRNLQSVQHEIWAETVSDSLTAKPGLRISNYCSYF